jgi:hypothetical protein
VQRSVKNKILQTDLAPDEVRIIVDWDKFTIGSSVFVPAVDTAELITQVKLIALRNLWTIEYRHRIENKLWGVRFWRVL